MIGSSPLILLNDLILNSNRALPVGQQMETFSLFSVTPIGLALVATGIAYFVLAGRLFYRRSKAPRRPRAVALPITSSAFTVSTLQFTRSAFHWKVP